MDIELEERTLGEARYIIENSSTLRTTAKKINVSKSLVHKDVMIGLKVIDNSLWLKVKEVLEYNKSIRHIRGGLANKLRCELQKEQNEQN